mmetsp:Transcript_30649/g.89080  ORF Transcript_30649/g.89080 Transcript_30649/m.89080 type:complete len:210 (+) Transcript_30649:10-639(+)
MVRVGVGVGVLLLLLFNVVTLRSACHVCSPCACCRRRVARPPHRACPAGRRRDDLLCFLGGCHGATSSPQKLAKAPAHGVATRHGIAEDGSRQGSSAADVEIRDTWHPEVVVQDSPSGNATHGVPESPCPRVHVPDKGVTGLAVVATRVPGDGQAKEAKEESNGEGDCPSEHALRGIGVANVVGNPAAMLCSMPQSLTVRNVKIWRSRG